MCIDHIKPCENSFRGYEAEDANANVPEDTYYSIFLLQVHFELIVCSSMDTRHALNETM
jgi:hypothetical protein